MLVALCTGALMSSGPVAFAASTPAAQAPVTKPQAPALSNSWSTKHPVTSLNTVHTKMPILKAAARVTPVVHKAKKAVAAHPAPVIHLPAAKAAVKAVAKAAVKPAVKAVARAAAVKKAPSRLFSTARTQVPAPYTEHGIAMHYYQGLFETVARNRGMYMRKDVDGYASRQNCGELGRVVSARVRNPYNGVWGPWRTYQILDCSARKDVGYHRQIGLILEIDYNSAVVTGIAWRGRSEVEVRP